MAKGLTTKEALKRQATYGKNVLNIKAKRSPVKVVFGYLKDPMFILLVIGIVIYLLLEEFRDAALFAFLTVVILIVDIVQEWRTEKALIYAEDGNISKITVIRDSMKRKIDSTEIVPGDVIIVEEGGKIPVDGFVINAEHLMVDESFVTGEPEAVFKVSVDKETMDTAYWKKDYCYKGTFVTQGRGTILVDKIGMETVYGQMGVPEKEIDMQTPLQKQVKSLIKLLIRVAIILFIIVTIISFINLPEYELGERIIQSLLGGVTIAFAIIPEDFPVTLTIFLILGAWRLSRRKSMVRKLPGMERIGEVSVLCVDKTGVVTRNRMTVEDIWTPDGNIGALHEAMVFAIEKKPFDPIEKAMLAYSQRHGIRAESFSKDELLYDFPYTQEAKLMGQVWERDETVIIGVKGNPENLLELVDLPADKKTVILEQASRLSKEGLVVEAVGLMTVDSVVKAPKRITDCQLVFKGLVGLEDPPQKSVNASIEKCLKAGIKVVMLTDEDADEAMSIAEEIGLPNSQQFLSGPQLSEMTDEELKEAVENINLFSNVFPESKVRIVKAFKDNDEVVAMTGAVASDAIALKEADLGIAMGAESADVVKEAADLVLLDGNFSSIVTTIKEGRRAYDDIRNNVGFIFTIHIPVVFASFFGPLFDIDPELLLLLPLHIILLELIIDPVCSIFLERQPSQPDVMTRKPRPANEPLMDRATLFKGIAQGFVLFVFSFGVYMSILDYNPENSLLARTMGLTIIIIANLFLVQVNRSDTVSAYNIFKMVVKDKIIWVVTMLALIGILLMIYSPLNGILDLTPLTSVQFLYVILIAGISVFWYEIVKWFRRRKEKKRAV